MKYITSLLFLVLGFSTGTFAQSKNWYQSDRTDDAPFNINVEKVYSQVLQNKSSRPVVVAVIDTGVDIDHVDLAGSIWINTDEVPGNGLDDDRNGYVDDYYGWNFIGGKDGSHVHEDTYEITRLYSALRQKYDGISPSELSEREKEEYALYSTYGEKIEKEVSWAKKNYEEYKSQEELFSQVLDHLENAARQRELSKSIADSLSQEMNRLSIIGSNILNYYNTELGYLPGMQELREDILAPLVEGKKYFGNKFMYNYNVDFNPRAIVGDNYDDPKERFYGNNSVEGPHAMHGTHVSGIIGAIRNNKVGMDGIADNVRIMVLRALPDGDERDKDVANAIRYAVENGASIINMSFGKGQSPNKQIVDDAVRFAEKNDVLLVHAAGNESEDISNVEYYPNDHYLKPKGFLFWKKKQPKNWICVGASSNSPGEKMVAGFSNYSKTEVDVFAPGEYMYSTTPGNNYEISQGTSQAAPVVAGVAAVIRSYYPALTAQQVKEVIIRSSKPMPIDVTKPGTEELVSFSELSVSGGIVDLEAALMLAKTIKGKKKIKSDNKSRA